MQKIYTFYKSFIYQNRAWIYFIVGLAVLWAAFGFFLSVSFPSLYPGFVRFIDEVFAEALGEIGSESDWELAVAIFRQNTLVTFYDLFLGAILGLVPVISIVVNFFALGFLAGPVASADPAFTSITLPQFFLAIAPHGIFEIPAIFLAAGFGMRFGWAWLLPSSSGKRWKVFKVSFFDVLKILPLVIVLLVVAAMIEGFVTGKLIGV